MHTGGNDTLLRLIAAVRALTNAAGHGLDGVGSNRSHELLNRHHTVIFLLHTTHVLAALQNDVDVTGDQLRKLQKNQYKTRQ